MKKFLLLFAALSFSVQLLAQTHRVTGIVTGSDDQPLAGVSVIEKGTLNGVASDIDGKFSLTACRCIGACGLAPVLTVNEEVYGRLTVDDVDGILEKYGFVK